MYTHYYIFFIRQRHMGLWGSHKIYVVFHKIYFCSWKISPKKLNRSRLMLSLDMFDSPGTAFYGEGQHCLSPFCLRTFIAVEKSFYGGTLLCGLYLAVKARSPEFIKVPP